MLISTDLFALCFIVCMSIRAPVAIACMPKTVEHVFGSSTTAIMRSAFHRKRLHLANTLQNPRLLQIKLHTFRHWKATMEYHKTKDILHVKQMLGHKNINSTLLYTQLINFENEEFTVRAIDNLNEACELVETGFEYVTDMEGKKIFRKRK